MVDFHKHGIYGGVRVWCNMWEMFRRMPSREVVVVAGMQWLSWLRRDFLFFSSNTHILLEVRGHLASFTSLLVEW